MKRLTFMLPASLVGIVAFLDRHLEDQPEAVSGGVG